MLFRFAITCCYDEGHAGCGGVVIKHCIIQYTTVPLLCNLALAALNHLLATSSRLQQLLGSNMGPGPTGGHCLLPEQL